ncbi:YdcF family protein [Pedobacter agri]|uniref:YdcF family protein n=1 Tax=Pedobacter agri TaxID=454586 RepID=UPI002930F2E4|nr:YdcF family protein [Pedobacter agri]
MMFILSKILIYLLKPYIWIFILLICASIFRKSRRKFLLVALAFFFIFSNGFIIGKLLNWYEPDYPAPKIYDVGIVLGGYSGYNERNKKIEFGSSGDRLFQAIDLYKQGRIKKILLSSGSANLLDTTQKEADLTLPFLRQIGIPDSSIIIENLSRNTIENAKNSLSIIEKQKPGSTVLVITSAWHIPRSKIIFDRFSKSELDYYPTDFWGKTEYDFADFVVPSASAMQASEQLIKEWVGYVVDRIRG